MWHKPCRTFNPWCLCIKTRCLFYVVPWLYFRCQALILQQHCQKRRPTVRPWGRDLRRLSVDTDSDICSAPVIVELHSISSQRTHDVIITLSLRQNNVAMLFWCNNDVIITSGAPWSVTKTDIHVDFESNWSQRHTIKLSVFLLPSVGVHDRFHQRLGSIPEAQCHV